MSIARSVSDVLRNHVVMELEAVDRMYLNVYVPQLQTVGAVVGYLRVHRGQRFASTAAVTPITEAFVRSIEQFVSAEAIDLVTFEKGQRKDDITQKYLRSFRKSEGVLYVGKAQEKARVFRTERRRSRSTGATYPWIVQSTAMVNDYYFYCVDEDFGRLAPRIGYSLDMITRAAKKVNIHKRSGLSTLVFFDLPGEQTSSRAASRRGVRPGAAFIFARWRAPPILDFQVARLVEGVARARPGPV